MKIKTETKTADDSYGTMRLCLEVGELILSKERQLNFVLPMGDRAFLHAMLIKTLNDIALKFVRGSREHGGCLTDRPALPELIDEAHDLLVYAEALRVQMEMANKS